MDKRSNQVHTRKKTCSNYRFKFTFKLDSEYYLETEESIVHTNLGVRQFIVLKLYSGNFKALWSTVNLGCIFACLNVVVFLFVLSLHWYKLYMKSTCLNHSLRNQKPFFCSLWTSLGYSTTDDSFLCNISSAW